jgi:putative intracellular protease/amidase
VPFVSYAVIDEDLTTGQNPAWGKETASKVAALVLDT